MEVCECCWGGEAGREEVVDVWGEGEGVGCWEGEEGVVSLGWGGCCGCSCGHFGVVEEVI